MKLNKIILCVVALVSTSITHSCNKCKNHSNYEQYHVYNNTDSTVTIKKSGFSDTLTILAPYKSCNLNYDYLTKAYEFSVLSGRATIDSVGFGTDDTLSIFRSRVSQYIKVNDRGCEFHDGEYIFTINQADIDKMK